MKLNIDNKLLLNNVTDYSAGLSGTHFITINNSDKEETYSKLNRTEIEWEIMSLGILYTVIMIPKKYKIIKQ